MLLPRVSIRVPGQETRRGTVRALSPAVGPLWVVLFVSLPSLAEAQTVRDIANRGACSTAGLEGISRQLAESQRCLNPGEFVSFEGEAGITVTSARVHPYLQATARDALVRAAAAQPLRINSAFRTLADQYVLYHSGGCGLAAEPGRSNHQTGRAVDVDNYSAARSALQSAGCAWLGSSDPVHFDCPGADRRSDSVLTFQIVWNLNHPDDRIDEDGLYGPMTAARVAASPAAGFRRDACTCEASCDGTTIVGTDCSRTDCAPDGGICSTALGAPSCVASACVAGPAEMPRARDVCLEDGRLGHCTDLGTLESVEQCAEGDRCIPIDGEAMCAPADRDAGVIAGGDAGSPPIRQDAGPGGSSAVSGGCSAAGTGGFWLAGFALIALARRRRRSR